MIPILFENKEDCCACGACLNICPKKAIHMVEDEYGFMYPKIDSAICVECGQCMNTCAFQKGDVGNTPIDTYAAVCTIEEVHSKSASGGIFAALACEVLNVNGVVYGASFDETWKVHHIAVDNHIDLSKLQGSKYTQSNTESSYKEVKEKLVDGYKVLYSGTPCQIAGLYSYLGKEYENLFTVDIICHGVPNNKMFLEYLETITSGMDIENFTFRDKTIGWGKNGSIVLNDKDNQKKKKIWQSASSYLYYFSKGWIFRDSCYKCKYASIHRAGDVTLGDYWGIEKEHPEYIGNNGWDESKGISVIIVNTEKGQRLLEQYGNDLEIKSSSLEKCVKHNAQLNVPSKPGKRTELMEEYLHGGWTAVQRYFESTIGWKKYSSQVKSYIPVSIKRIIKGKL